jgi:hypothetical protein
MGRSASSAARQNRYTDPLHTASAERRHPAATSYRRAQRQATLQIITAAEAAGHARVAEMNRQVAGNLGKIITALEADSHDEQQVAADAPSPCRPARPGRGTTARADPAPGPSRRCASSTGPAIPSRSLPSPPQPGSPGPGSIPRPTSAAKVRKLRNDAPGRDPATAIPAGQRAAGESLRARLTAALTRNQQLADENARLRQLARALGDQRSSRTRSGNNPAQ